MHATCHFHHRVKWSQRIRKSGQAAAAAASNTGSGLLGECSSWRPARILDILNEYEITHSVCRLLLFFYLHAAVFTHYTHKHAKIILNVHTYVST